MRLLCSAQSLSAWPVVPRSLASEGGDSHGVESPVVVARGTVCGFVKADLSPLEASAAAEGGSGDGFGDGGPAGV